MLNALTVLAARWRPLGVAGWALAAVVMASVMAIVLASVMAVVLGRAAVLDDAPAAPVLALRAVPAWIEDPEGARLFAMPANAFGAAPAFHAARRQAAGPGRIEQLAFGSPEAGAPHLRVSVYRAGEDVGASVSFWLEMARRAAEAGLSLERSPAVPDVAPTRLGDFHVGALRVRSAASLRACMGFRHEATDPPLVISGLACLEAGERETREALVCALEGLAIADPAGDPPAAAFFARARARSPECRAHVARMASAGPERRR